MARALVAGFRDVDVDGEDAVLTASVVFLGPDIEADRTAVAFRIGPTTTPADARDALVTAVVAAATARGYSVARTAVLVPSFSRGV